MHLMRLRLHRYLQQGHVAAVAPDLPREDQQRRSPGARAAGAAAGTHQPAAARPPALLPPLPEYVLPKLPST